MAVGSRDSRSAAAHALVEVVPATGAVPLVSIDSVRQPSVTRPGFVSENEAFSVRPWQKLTVEASASGQTPPCETQGRRLQARRRPCPTLPPTHRRRPPRRCPLSTRHPRRRLRGTLHKARPALDCASCEASLVCQALVPPDVADALAAPPDCAASFEWRLVAGRSTSRSPAVCPTGTRGPSLVILPHQLVARSSYTFELRGARGCRGQGQAARASADAAVAGG